MISGNVESLTLRVLILLLAAAVPLTTSTAADDSAKRLITSLARSPPDRIEFVEVRFSPLLSTPLTATGTLEYLAPGELARNVEAPFRERTTIAAGKVKIQREGQRDRTFSLDRAPELRGLLTSFAALLAGDVAALEQQFMISLESAPLNGNGWRLVLSPRDKNLAKRLGAVVVTGSETTPHCIIMSADHRAGSVTLLGEHAIDAHDASSLAVLENSCLTGE